MFRICSLRSPTPSTYGLSIGIGLSVFFILTLSVCADEYELQYKVLDLRKEGVYTSGQFMRPSTRSEERLSAEPKYRSRMPVYIVARFGSDADNKYTIVLDESKGMGRGYDVLYVDSNNNENLTDDRKIAGRVRQQGRNFTVGNFGPVEVMVNYGDRMAPYYFSVEYNLHGKQRIQLGGRGRRYVNNMNLRLQTSGYYTGVVSFGNSECRIAVVDFNGNGLFNEYFKPRSDIRGSEERLYAIGDQILIDLNGDGRFERGQTGNKELYPYAKHLQVDGTWYSVDISAHGGNVDVQIPNNLKFGTIKISNQTGSCLLQLASSNGILKFEETGKEYQVPTGTYQLYAHTTQVKHASVSWRYEASGTASGKQFQIARGDVLDLRFGAPILVNVSYYSRGRRRSKPKAGDTIELSLSLSGQGGEVYTNVQRGRNRPPAPTFRVVDELGKDVAKGTFEYG